MLKKQGRHWDGLPVPHVSVKELDTAALRDFRSQALRSLAYDGLQRVETYPEPDAALREAVLNAAVHNDYGSHVPIQISVYPDI